MDFSKLLGLWKISNVFIALCPVSFIVLIVEFYFSFRVMIDVFFMRQNTPPRRQENFWQRTLNFHKLHSIQYEKKPFKKYEKHNLREYCCCVYLRSFSWHQVSDALRVFHLLPVNRLRQMYYLLLTQIFFSFKLNMFSIWLKQVLCWSKIYGICK